MSVRPSAWGTLASGLDSQPRAAVEPWPVTVMDLLRCSTRHTDPPEPRHARARPTSFARRQNCTVSPSPCSECSKIVLPRMSSCPVQAGAPGLVSAVCGPRFFGALYSFQTWLILSELQMAPVPGEVGLNETGSKLVSCSETW